MCVIYAQYIFGLSAFRSLVMMNKIGVFNIYIYMYYISCIKYCMPYIVNQAFYILFMYHIYLFIY